MWPLRTFYSIEKASTIFLAQNTKYRPKFVLRLPINHDYTILRFKIGFLAINPKLSVSSHMLLHKSYVDVTIANILLYR